MPHVEDWKLEDRVYCIARPRLTGTVVGADDTAPRMPHERPFIRVLWDRDRSTRESHLYEPEELEWYTRPAPAEDSYRAAAA